MSDHGSIPENNHTPDSSDICHAGSSNRVLITGFRAVIVNTLLTIHVIAITILKLRNPIAVTKTLIILRNIRRKVHGLKRVNRYVKSGGRFFWSENIPGWPSRSFTKHIKCEIDRTLKNQNGYHALQTVIWAITYRCSLNCEHCCEGDKLASDENLSLHDLIKIREQLTRLGLYHIQLSGGEPLCRFDDLLQLLYTAPKGIDFWILTSGVGLTEKKARLLKRAGLTGAIISLDHWNEKFHNTFRNSGKSFDWARNAAKACRDADILVALSLCATRFFVSYENLQKYLQLAKEWGVGFIRIIEPMAAGNYKGKDIRLHEKHIRLLKDFYFRINTQKEYSTYPIIMYQGYHQRLQGCFGSGNRYLYIDTIGDIHACPFCRGKAGNTLVNPMEDAIGVLRKIGCQEFSGAVI